MSFARAKTVSSGAAAPPASDDRRRELVYFFAATFGVTWGIAAIALLFPGLFQRLFGELSKTSPVYFVAVYAPSVAALVLAYSRKG